MLKSILIGLDGSPYSETAMELGLEWAKRFEALLVGLGIIDRPSSAAGEGTPPGAGGAIEQRDEPLVADARRKVESYLGQFSVRCARAQVACKVLEDVGLPWQEIVREAERCDMVLLGKRTYFHFESEESVDDTLQQVVRHSPRPVVTAPETLGGQGVLVAYDGSLPAARTLQVFESLGLAEGEEVHIVSVFAEYDEAARTTGRAADFLGFHGVRTKAHPVASSASPGNVLMEQVRKLNPRLVVMGAHGKPAWRETLFGSVTRTMVRMSPVPVFLGL
jgi:nucleotide-binding universal stress UspA family protein